MLSKDKEAALQKICSAFGGNIEYAQGGGANASAKEGEIMIIKASGYTLADMMSKNGYVELRYRPIAEIYTTENSITEDEARALIQRAIINSPPYEGGARGGSLKPSIETGFHSFLNTFVIHLHPIYLIAILCLENCEAILGELYRDLNFVVANYQRPGHYLSREVAKKLKQSPLLMKPARQSPDGSSQMADGEGWGGGSRPIVSFLKNHGLIVSSNEADICLNTARAVCARAKEYVLRQTGLPALVYQANPDQDQDAGEYLYPDAVVFLRELKTKKNLSGEQIKNVDEVLFAHNAIANLAQRLGKYRALSNTEVQELMKMEEEKYRKNLSKSV